jgi:Zn-dependent peptidase ImmA (M78 family)
MKNNNLKNLKHLFSLTLLVLLTLTSCNNSNKIEDECETFFKNQLNDPKSYERISIKLTDTLKSTDSLFQVLQTNSENLKKVYINLTLADFSKKLDENSKIQDSTLKVIEKLRTDTKNNKVYRYVYQLEYRAKNSFGALTKGKAIIHYNPNGKDSNKKFFIYSNK